MEEISVWRACSLIASKAGRSSEVWYIFIRWRKMSTNESFMSGATLPRELSKWLLTADVIAFFFIELMLVTKE